VKQGQEIGRVGRVHVWVDVCEVRVGGTACFVRELLIDLP
jgi:predicted PhzF superfamily epimerase YddE/YHI9